MGSVNFRNPNLFITILRKNVSVHSMATTGSIGKLFRESQSPNYATDPSVGKINYSVG